jgi:hypothetical protein
MVSVALTHKVACLILPPRSRKFLSNRNLNTEKGSLNYIVAQHEHFWRVINLDIVPVEFLPCVDGIGRKTAPSLFH